ncbi:hypothetical protein RCC89_00445 [Cytophagaceae bacterium ABcell3]|nr:hypothetical protein RCC89_00445 [Cytophagaceae bacterium ABcell3]
MNKTASCFSEANFEMVYLYLEEQKMIGHENGYTFGGYTLCLSEEQGQIFIKKDAYSLVVISKEGGVAPLAKRMTDNKRLEAKANEIFCQLLSLAQQS